VYFSLPQDTPFIKIEIEDAIATAGTAGRIAIIFAAVIMEPIADDCSSVSGCGPD
jgi:hypothetical protein